MSITVGDYVQTTEEYNDFCTISGEVIEDYGNTVVIIDDDDNRIVCDDFTKLRINEEAA